MPRKLPTSSGKLKRVGKPGDLGEEKRVELSERGNGKAKAKGKERNAAMRGWLVRPFVTSKIFTA